MRKLKHLFWLVLVFLPQWAFAATGDQLRALAPGVYDRSVTYLGDIFGTVPGVLHGTSGELLSNVFYVFNYGLVIAASVFVGYAIFRSVIDTANEGNFMGQGKNAAYISMRVAGGLGLLAPILKGYSAVQVVVMFIVLHGAGFADLAWSRALTYLHQGGVVFVPPQNNPQDTVTLVQMSSQVFTNQVCMYRSKAFYDQQKQQVQDLASKDPKNPVYQQQLSAMNKGSDYWKPQFDDKNSVVNFPGGSTDQLATNACGSISWKISTADNKDAPKYAKMALQQMLITMDGPAQELGALPPPKNQMLVVTDYSPAQAKEDDSEGALIGAAADYLNITIPARNNSSAVQQNQAILDKFYEDSKAEGWVTAGSYYYNLALLKSDLDAASNFTLQDYKEPDLSAFNSDDKTQIQALTTQIQQYEQLAVQEMLQQGIYNSNVNTLLDEFGVQSSSTYTSSWTSNTSNIIQALFGPLFYEPVKGWLEMISGQKSDGTMLPADPLLRIQGYGYDLMSYLPDTFKSEAGNAIEWIFTPWKIGGNHSGITGMIISALMTIVSPLLEPVLKILALLALVPFFLILAGLFFATGAVMAFYIPLIPFILFTVGIIGWLIAVIEAMVAAPLVAVGITHPEGHDLMGKSEQAVMLTLSVFIRPITMIIGLLAGMVLSYVVLYVLNAGFGSVIESFVAEKSSLTGDSWGVIKFAMPLLLISIYVSLAVSLIQKAYSLIYIIPEKTMRWIGLSPDHDSDATQIVQQGQSVVSTGASKGFEGAKSSGAALGKAGFELGKQGAKAAMGGV